MLVAHTNSSCDVCIDTYHEARKAPFAIDCGHTFCYPCLNSIFPRKCPLCRIPFDLTEIRKVHVGFNDDAPPPVKSSTRAAGLADTSSLMAEFPFCKAKRLQRRIADVIKEGTSTDNLTEEDIRIVLSEVQEFLDGEEGEQFPELRSTNLMLFKLAEKFKQCNQLEYEIASLRDQRARFEAVTIEIQSQNQFLQRSNNLLRKEHEQHRGIEDEWKRKYFDVLEINRKLRDYSHMRSTPDSFPHPHPFSSKQNSADNLQELRERFLNLPTTPLVQAPAPIRARPPPNGEGITRMTPLPSVFSAFSPDAAATDDEQTWTIMTQFGSDFSTGGRSTPSVLIQKVTYGSSLVPQRTTLDGVVSRAGPIGITSTGTSKTEDNTSAATSLSHSRSRSWDVNSSVQAGTTTTRGNATQMLSSILATSSSNTRASPPQITLTRPALQIDTTPRGNQNQQTVSSQRRAVPAESRKFGGGRNHQPKSWPTRQAADGLESEWAAQRAEHPHQPGDPLALFCGHIASWGALREPGFGLKHDGLFDFNPSYA